MSYNQLEKTVRWLYCKVKDGAVGGIQSIVAGDNVTIDNTDPLNPIVSAIGGGSEPDEPIGLWATPIGFFPHWSFYLRRQYEFELYGDNVSSEISYVSGEFDLRTKDDGWGEQRNISNITYTLSPETGVENMNIYTNSISFTIYSFLDSPYIEISYSDDLTGQFHTARFTYVALPPIEE